MGTRWLGRAVKLRLRLSAATLRPVLDVMLRLWERLSWTQVTVNYDFDSAPAAQAACAVLRQRGIPAEVTQTETGPVLLLNESYRERAERHVPALCEQR